ncbi:MAG: MarP family serine protease [Acidimicrobiia bacterium]
MNFLDLVIGIAAAVAAYLGYRLGFLRRVFSWAGLALGVFIALVFVDNVADALRGSPPRTRLLVALGFVFLVATISQAIGLAVGNATHRQLTSRVPAGVRHGDRIAGAVTGAAGVLVLVWLLIPALASSPGWPAQAVRNSVLARAIDRIAPDPPDQAETLGRLVGDQTFPEVFDTLTSPDAGVPPDGGIPDAAAARVRASVVKVAGTACDRVQEGTGFVVADNLVVTNAHVVAGESRTRVDTPDDRRLDAQVVAFDPNRDLAVLRVFGLALAPLARDEGHVDERGALFGHPGGGDLRESPMRVAEQIVARGTNIQHTESTEREVFVLAVVTAPGDSGAPVVNTDGHVIGVLFAFDIARETTAYALTNAELTAVLAPVLSTPTPTPKSTGPCLSD